jgi:hypothetical protein
MKHKRTAKLEARTKPPHEEDVRIAVTFLLPPALARAVCEAAVHSKTLLYPAVIKCDHIILARPRKLELDKPAL